MNVTVSCEVTGFHDDGFDFLVGLRVEGGAES